MNNKSRQTNNILENMKTEQDLKNTFGLNVKIRRESRGWSQEVLAEKAKVSKNTISDIETGQKFARAKTLICLAEALETTVYELLKPDDVKPDNNTDIIAKYGEQIKKAVDRIGNFYIGSSRK